MLQKYPKLQHLFSAGGDIDYIHTNPNLKATAVEKSNIKPYLC